MQILETSIHKAWEFSTYFFHTLIKQRPRQPIFDNVKKCGIPVTKGVSGFLVKTVVSASGSRRLSGFSHGKFYFYYHLKLRTARALAILMGSLPPVCHLLYPFLGSLGI
jgi:hypothetical protein